MAKHGIEVKVGATAVQGPRGFSIKEVKFKETLPNGDNVYQIVIEDNSMIGEILVKKGDKGDKGEVGATGNGIDKIELIDNGEDYRTYRITFTNGTNFDWTVNDGYSAYEIAVDNGYEGTEQEWLESLIGKGLEFEWKGTQLGVRVEGETEYKYVDLKGQAGENGKNLEFNWRGTELGVRVQGQPDYQYVNLKGEKGQAGVNGTNGADGVGIKDITLKGQDSNGGNVYTITFTNETTKEFTAPRGPKGEGASIDLSNYYTKPEIDTKFKNLNLVPVPIGGILFMYNTSNPAELYPNTTWELLPDNKFLKTGSTPLQQAGSNSVKIAKANLPTDKLQVEAHSMTRGTMNITGTTTLNGAEYKNSSFSGAFYGSAVYIAGVNHVDGNAVKLGFEASRSWAGSTSSASPYTAQMGSGTPISINPEHITVKAWKRLS